MSHKTDRKENPVTEQEKRAAFGLLASMSAVLGTKGNAAQTGLHVMRIADKVHKLACPENLSDTQKCEAICEYLELVESGLDTFISALGKEKAP